jgi:signal transduction histidine kinase
MRLTLEFVLVALVATLAAIFMLGISWEQHFRQYTNDEMEAVAKTTVELLEERYAASGGWTAATTDTLEIVNALSKDFGIEVVDAGGKVVYSDLSSDSDGSAVAALPAGTRYEVGITYSSRGSKVTVGKVTVFPFPNVTLTPSDQEFKANTYIALLIAGLIAVTLAALIGIYLSRSLTRPLAHISAVSREVSSGDLSARTAMKGNDEFSRLGRAVDQMIASIEKNKNLERQLTADVAHELRTPLAAMQATIEAMVDGVLPTDATRLATLNSEVIRLNHLIDALFELSRLESGKTKFKMGVVDVSALVEELRLSHEMLVADAQLSMDCELDSGALARGDADLLRQAMTNLLSNAVRYTPAGGHISLKVHVQKGLVQVFVSDTGEGIAADDIPHVFSRFWRATTSRDRESGGLGIGLALVKEIVAKHKGSINVESELGVGSTFTLTLPLLKWRNPAAS